MNKPLDFENGGLFILCREAYDLYPKVQVGVRYQVKAASLAGCLIWPALHFPFMYEVTQPLHLADEPEINNDLGPLTRN